MLNNLKNNFHWIFYMLGLLAYIIFILINPEQFLVSILWLIFIVYSWVIIGIINQQYQVKQLIYITSLTGTIFSIVAFFLYGIEELPYPEGAIKFNGEVIIVICILLFIFLLPSLIICLGSLKIEKTAYIKSDLYHGKIAQEESRKNINQQVIEEWEEATLEDLESGKYEPI